MGSQTNGGETFVPAMILTTELNKVCIRDPSDPSDSLENKALQGTFRGISTGDPLGTLQGFLRILSNRWKTQDWLMQGPFRDPPGILQGPLGTLLCMQTGCL